MLDINYRPMVQIILLSLLILLAGGPRAQASVVQGPPGASLHPSDPAHLFLFPLTDQSVELLTHTVDISVGVENQRPVLDVRAGYRIHNTGSEALTVPLEVRRPEQQADRPPPEEISLSLEGQNLALQPSGSGQNTAQVEIGADTRRILYLSYRVRLEQGDLPTLQYPLRAISGWSGSPDSWRVTVTVPGENSGYLPDESWVSVTPEGWKYTGASVQWLGEVSVPEEPITWQVIAPALWQEIQLRQDNISGQPSVSDFLTVGGIYYRLYRSPQIDAESRERFYAQALAAYADGITYAGQLNVGGTDQARLHQALGQLYRSRSIRDDGSVNYAYVDLMIQEAENALAHLPADETAAGGQSRQEVTRWMADGLRLRYERAVSRAEWGQANRFLDRLQQLPAESVDGDWVAEQRRTIQLQQSLELLAQGDEQAALAIAGEPLGADVVNEELLPRPEHRAVFARWQVTVTVRTDDLGVVAVAHPKQGREAVAQQITESLQQAWSEHSAQTWSIEVDDENVTRIQVRGEELSDRLTLAQAIPPLPEWTLLRILLLTLEPDVEQEAHWIWQDVELTESLDLRPVSDQWSGVAALLERQAAEIQDPAGSTSNAEEQLRNTLKAINFRQESTTWRRLVDSSSVRIVLEASPGQNRTWIVQPADPAQTLQYSNQSMSLPRFILFALVIFGLVVIVSGILWLLL